MKDLINTTVRANQLIGISTYTGEILFLEKGFVFKAKGVNSNIVREITEYKNIASVTKRNILGLIPNGIIIKLKDNQSCKFVVEKRRDVISFLLFKMNEIG